MQAPTPDSSRSRGGYPRLTLSLAAVRHNTRVLTDHLLSLGIELVGVTKAVDGEPSVGRAMLEAGAAGLADSRLVPLTRLAGHALAPLTLIKPPQPDEVEAVAQVADRVLLSDVGAARALAGQAPPYPIEVLLTVDLGDRREGILPAAVPACAEELSRLPGIALAGMAVNFACLSGQLPSRRLFRQAEDILETIASLCGDEPLLSLGGSCCLQHLEGHRPRFRTEIRSGGGPLYGFDFVSDLPLAGLERTDPVLSAVVLECARKPPAPPGPVGLDAFGHVPDARLPEDDAWYALIALGRRDAEPEGLRPLLPGAWLAGMTSDVGVVIAPRRLTAGDTIGFAVHYDALVRAITSPYVAKEFVESAVEAETP